MNNNSMKLKKKEATEFLNKRGRRIELILCGLVLVFTAIAPIFIYSYVSELVFWGTDLIADALEMGKKAEEALGIFARVVGWIMAVAFVVFVTCPTYSSYFGFSYKLYRNGMAGNGVRFPEKKAYIHELLNGGVIFGALLVSFIPIALLIDLGNLALDAISKKPFINKLIEMIDNEEVRKSISNIITDEKLVSSMEAMFFILVLVGLVLSFLVFLLFKPLFLVGYFTARGSNAKEAVKMSVEKMRTPSAKSAYKAYIKSFLPALLLSLVSLLTLFFADTLPKMTTVYFRVADEIVYGEN